jgi:hypothetical protein
MNNQPREALIARQLRDSAINNSPFRGLRLNRRDWPRRP